MNSFEKERLELAERHLKNKKEAFLMSKVEQCLLVVEKTKETILYYEKKLQRKKKTLERLCNLSLSDIIISNVQGIYTFKIHGKVFQEED